MRRNGAMTTSRCASLERLEARLLLDAASPVQRPVYNTGTGFFVLDGNVYDANGHAFVMKGPNNNHAWGSYANNYLAIDQIARTGANAARLVMYKDIGPPDQPGEQWSDAADTPARRQVVVERYLANGIVPVVEDHASIHPGTENPQPNPAALHQIVSNWLENTWLKTYEPYVILNIANEWGPPAGANGNNTVWRDAYIEQVLRLRAGPDGNLATEHDNINALLMIDAGQWGQDFNTLQYHAQQILDADPQKNIVFSIHLYGQWRAEDRNYEVNGAANSDYGPWDMHSRLSSLRNRPQPLPLAVGEWAWEDFRDFSGLHSPYAAYRTQRVMEICDELGIGYLGWSWNHSSPTTLNMIAGQIQDYQYNSNTDLTGWGNAIVNDPDFGTKATAARATVFPTTNLPNPPSPLPALPSAAPSDVRFVLEQTLVHVAEGGLGAARVKLSKQPDADLAVTLSKIGGGTNDPDVSLATTSLLFTTDNWSTYQPILLAAAADGDATMGSAKFQLSAAGLLSADFLARDVEPPTASSIMLNPDRDRLYNGSGSASSVTVTSAFPPNALPNGTLFMRFNLGAVTGKVASATLRVFTTNTAANRFVRVLHAISDTWTEGSTSGINASYPVHPSPRPPGDGFALPTSGGGYMQINFPELTDLIRAEHWKDGFVTLALRMVSNSAVFHTREGANPPQLVLETVEAVPPQVVSSAYDFSANPHALSFGFSEDVSASLSGGSVIVESLTEPGTTLALSAPAYDAGTNTATFAFADGIIPDGRYSARLIASGVLDPAGNAMPADEVLTFSYLRGDFNGDGVVNLADFNILAANFGAAGATYAQGDANYDGVVNLADFNVLAAQFGRALPAASPGAGGSLFAHGGDDDDRDRDIESDPQETHSPA